MTIGAPITAVTELMEISVGANIHLASTSQKRQNTAPPKKQAGIITIGLAVPKRHFMRWGTAMPTKEIGPAKAVTQADKRLDNKISTTRSNFI